MCISILSARLIFKVYMSRTSDVYFASSSVNFWSIFAFVFYHVHLVFAVPNAFQHRLHYTTLQFKFAFYIIFYIILYYLLRASVNCVYSIT